jgi:hypothetical protein
MSVRSEVVADDADESLALLAELLQQQRSVVESMDETLEVREHDKADEGRKKMIIDKEKIESGKVS